MHDGAGHVEWGFTLHDKADDALIQAVDQHSIHIQLI